MEVVNQTAAQLTESVEEIQDPDVLPLPISNICGKTFLFKLSIESSNIVFNSDVYKVTKIVTQSDMVKEFSKISGFLTTPDVKSEEMGFITPDEQVCYLGIRCLSLILYECAKTYLFKFVILGS
ncbi:hypothetical protein EUTSA_v10000605mg [Eutrema salsugineum]|uniref:Uncharacterized protein n=1 Tax=Eutrema salsugineum TaxID=72664 RepID=V4M366_EUTSA|nr:hypothetical protein EUTSA_v10000605mg [Eutrema salsugineum]